MTWDRDSKHAVNKHFQKVGNTRTVFSYMDTLTINNVFQPVWLPSNHLKTKHFDTVCVFITAVPITKLFARGTVVVGTFPTVRVQFTTRTINVEAIYKLLDYKKWICTVMGCPRSCHQAEAQRRTRVIPTHQTPMDPSGLLRRPLTVAAVVERDPEVCIRGRRPRTRAAARRDVDHHDRKTTKRVVHREAL